MLLLRLRQGKVHRYGAWGGNLGLPGSWRMQNCQDPGFWELTLGESFVFSPLAVISWLLEVRGCSLEEEIGCEESTGEDGGVSTKHWASAKERRPLNSPSFSTQTVLACICKTELCNENWVEAGSSTTNQGSHFQISMEFHVFSVLQDSGPIQQELREQLLH